MANKLTVANLVMGLGAIVTVLFSFFDFYSIGSLGWNAWSTDAFAFLSTIPAILAIVMIAWIAAEMAGAKLPDDVLTFTGGQMKATWGVASLGIMLGFATVDFGGADKGIGFWFMLLGSIAMTAGAVMSLLGKGNEAVGGASDTASSTASSGGATPPPPPPPPPAP